MSKDWVLVNLDKIIKQRKEFIEIDDFQKYKRCRVKLHAQGIELRDIVQGAEIKTKKQQICRTDDLLVAEIDAKIGGFGIVPANLDGAIVSSHYFLFEINELLLNIKFLDYFIRTPAFGDQVSAQGSTNYAAIRSNDVLRYTIPIPSLEEQGQIVARVEEMVGKVQEVRSLRQKVIEECNALCRAIIFFNASEAIPTPLHKLVRLRETDVAVSPEETYNFAGVYCFGRGLFRQQNQKGIEFSYKNLTRLKAGNFVYPKLMAWEGALGIVPPELDGCVVSPEFPVFEVNENRVLPEVLDVYFRTPSVWDTLGQISTGTNVRRRRLHPSNFLEFKIPLPSMRTQQQLREVKRKVDTMKQQREETMKELDALLPSILDKAFKGEL